MRALHLSALLVACAFAAGASAAGTRADLDGVWLFADSQPPKDPGLTPAGLDKLQKYDPLRDDGDTRCNPMSFTNVMHTPSPPIEIRQSPERVEIDYEFMDVRRRIPLRGELAKAPYTVADHPNMGRSIGRYDNEDLVVDTIDAEPGYLDTLGIPGLPRSAQMRTEERFTATAADRLTVVVTHHDPVYYVRPMVVTYHFVRVATKIMEWGCTIEGANYEKRIDAAEGK
jgi:hypothetical protein